MSNKNNVNSPNPTKNDRLTRAQLNAPATVGSMQDALDGLFKKLELSFQMKLDDAVTRLEDEVKNIGNDVTNLQDRVAALESNSKRTSVAEVAEVCNEIKERTRRANNVIFFGFKEIEDQIDDLLKVNNLLSEIGLDFEAKHIFRLGRKIQDRSRPLKVVFDSPHKVVEIFRGKKTLSDKGINVRNDQTPNEQEYFKGVRAVLQSRIEKGEKNLTIKYINQIPTIVTKNA